MRASAVVGAGPLGELHLTAKTEGLLKLVPGLMNALLLFGSAYIAWIGWSVLRSSQGAGSQTTAAPAMPAQVIFRRAALTCLMNPKAYLFMLAIFPQFMRVEYGPVWLQATLLGLIIAATQTAIYGFWALAAGGSRSWLEARPRLAIAASRIVGILLISGAAWTAWQGWQD